jgi:hypothetical protein
VDACSRKRCGFVGSRGWVYRIQMHSFVCRGERVSVWVFECGCGCVIVYGGLWGGGYVSMSVCASVCVVYVYVCVSTYIECGHGFPHSWFLSSFQLLQHDTLKSAGENTECLLLQIVKRNRLTKQGCSPFLAQIWLPVSMSC